MTDKLKNSNITHGQFVDVPIDLAVGTEIMIPFVLKEYEKMDTDSIFDPDKIVIVNDHFVPAKDIASANLAKTTRDYARHRCIKNFFEIGRSGICHVTVPEKGFVVPGDVVIGVDSHTCTLGALGALALGIGATDMAAAWVLGSIWLKVPQTIKVVLCGSLNKYVTGKDVALYLLKLLGVDGALYKIIEFAGSGLSSLSMADRFTLCNMVVEMGAKTGIIPADEITYQYLEGRTDRKGTSFEPDKNSSYCEVIEINLSDIDLMIAAPYDPGNVFDAKELKGVNIDQILIGSCTNGRIEDYRIAWSIIKGRKIADNIRLLLLPGSPDVLKRILHEDMLEDFINAGAVIGPSSCGPCIGGHLGVLGDEETGLYTTNRNFVGRNGAKSSKVYLCGPAVAAFSAISGHINTAE